MEAPHSTSVPVSCLRVAIATGFSGLNTYGRFAALHKSRRMFMDEHTFFFCFLFVVACVLVLIVFKCGNVECCQSCELLEL